MLLTLLDENIGTNLFDLGQAGVLDMTPKSQATKEKDINWTLLKFKTLKKIEKAPHRRNYFQIIYEYEAFIHVYI